MNLPTSATDFINSLKDKLHNKLKQLNDTILSNEKIKILDKDKGRIKLSPSVAQIEPANLKKLHQYIQRRWSTINLIDILKEVDLRYIKRRFINSVNVTAVIAEVVNKILEIRDPRIWGEATTGVACDSTKVSA